MEDEEIIELYWKRDEQAVHETQRAYGDYCRRVACGILNDPQDVEEVLADTWLHAWNSIPPQKPKFLKLYLAKIARNLAFSAFRSRSAAKRGGNAVFVALDELGECVSSPCSAESHYDAQELGETINAFLRTASDKERMVFVRRYFFLDEIPQIARRYSLTETNVRMILSRTRSKLKKYLIQEGYDL